MLKVLQWNVNVYFGHKHYSIMYFVYSGNVVGYHVSKPCRSCLEAQNNGHYWMFYRQAILPYQRLNVEGKNCCNSVTSLYKIISHTTQSLCWTCMYLKLRLSKTLSDSAI